MRKPVDKIGPLNLDDIKDDPKNRIARMGIELEGGWKKAPAGVMIEGDASVFKNVKYPSDLYPYKGEIPIGPIQPIALAKSMRKYYPDYVDATCGMHVHMSFEKVLHYSWLMNPQYPATIVEYLKRWAKQEGFSNDHYIFERLSGKSQFCQDVYWPDDQIIYPEKDYDKKRKGHRYTIVHYCGRKRTIEVRVLPMMATVEQAIRAVKCVRWITNASLYMLGTKEPKFGGKLELGNGMLYEEEIQTVDVPLSPSQVKRLKEDGEW